MCNAPFLAIFHHQRKVCWIQTGFIVFKRKPHFERMFSVWEAMIAWSAWNSLLDSVWLLEQGDWEPRTLALKGTS